MRTLNLTQKLFAVTALALLPAIVIVASNAIALQETRIREVHSEARKVAELASLEMERILSGTENVLRVAAAAPVVRSGDTAACSAFLTRAVSSLSYLASMAIIDPDGNVRCLPDQPKEDLFLGDRSYFMEAMKTPDRVTGVFTVGRRSGRNMLPVAMRFGENPEQVDGIAVAYIDLEWMQSKLEQRTFAEGSSLTIADRDGRILARAPNPRDFVGTLIPEAFQRLVKASAPGTEELTSQDGTRRVVGYIPASTTPQGIYVSAGISTKAAFQPVSDLALLGIIISLVGTAAAFLVARYTSRAFIVRPFKRLTETIEAWRRGQTDVRTNMLAADGEMGRAGSALDTFMDELMASRVARKKAEQHRELIAEELNHRVKNLLQLVQVVARQTFAQTGASDAVATFAGRLKAIDAANAALLQEDWQAAPLRDVVESCIAPFSDSRASQFTLEGPPLLLSSVAALGLGMALHELCTNAAKYGALSTEAGHVEITWSASDNGEEERFLLVWQERDGPPVKRPSKVGFGSKIIEQILAQQIRGEVALTYEETGVICRVSAPLGMVLARTVLEAA